MWASALAMSKALGTRIPHPSDKCKTGSHCNYALEGGCSKQVMEGKAVVGDAPAVARCLNVLEVIPRRVVAGQHLPLQITQGILMMMVCVCELMLFMHMRVFMHALNACSCTRTHASGCGYVC